MGKAAAVLSTGTTTTLKLFVGALAFTSVYVGVSAYGTANSAPAEAHTVTLAAQSMPITTPIAAVPGEISVAGGATEAGCSKTMVARSVLVNAKPGETVLYGWRLARWNATTKQWRSYLSDYAGFAAASRTVKWEPRIVSNPGWYRIELAVQDGKTIRSDRFQVSC